MKINRHISRSTQTGFSLIELLVVIGIMLVLVAAFAPSVVAALQAGNEQATVNNLHQVINAEVSYYRLYPSLGYSSTGTKLGGTSAQGCPATPDTTGTWSCLLSDKNASVLDGGILNGYKYTYTQGTISNSIVQAWTLTAVPSTPYAGRKAYCADSSGSIYYYPQSSTPGIDPTQGCTGGGIVLGQ